MPQNLIYIFYYPQITRELKLTVIHNLIGWYYGDCVGVSTPHHVDQYSPFSAGGAELQNLVKVVSIISS